MSSLKEIRKRLASIKSIQQLTKAMEMVAASRLHFAQVRAKQAQPYVAKIKHILNQLNASIPDVQHPLFEQREVKKVGILVMGADMGLAGSYNKDLIAATNRLLKKYDPSQVELILVGRKMIDYYKRREWPIRQKMMGWGEKTTKEQIRELSGQMVDSFLKKEVDEIWFVYTHYVSMSSRKVMVSKFLNIEEMAVDKTFTPINYILEPSAEEIYGEILHRYCFTTVQAALQETYASELAARIFAMKAASTNADDIIEKLTLIRNKVRQGSITREMIEITSGAESEKQHV